MSSSITPSSLLPWLPSLLSLPSQPGVYSFLGEKNKILYVGKAKNLRNRINSYKRYFQLTDRIKKLVTTAKKLEYQVLESDLEALLIEAELIRLHQPVYNILLKDDKSPIYLHLTNEKFPRILKIRKKQLYKGKIKGTVLGPFPSSYKLNEVLKIARRIFPWCNEAAKGRNKACFYYQLDLCPGACIGQISATDYQANIKELILFLRGKKKKIIKQLEKKMKIAASKELFEKAASYKNKIQLIKEVTEKKYKLQPELILPKLKQGQIKHALDHLNKILHFYLSLPKKYKLDRIEGFDVSNIQGTNPAVSMVVFQQGQAAKKHYRLFNIRTINTPNDYQMFKEAIIRRQNHPEWGMPKLIVIDGGKGQIRAVLSSLKWNIPVIGIAKNPDRIIIPIKKQEKKERLELSYQILRLQPDHPSLQLIQQIRDESHRFAKKQHSRLRIKEMLK
ncbi:MAG: GIY-YIG nuclease family protein [Candidatus Woesebacteria bacterium]